MFSQCECARSRAPASGGCGGSEALKGGGSLLFYVPPQTCVCRPHCIQETRHPSLVQSESCFIIPALHPEAETHFIDALLIHSCLIFILRYDVWPGRAMNSCWNSTSTNLVPDLRFSKQTLLTDCIVAAALQQLCTCCFSKV